MDPIDLLFRSANELKDAAKNVETVVNEVNDAVNAVERAAHNVGRWPVFNWVADLFAPKLIDEPQKNVLVMGHRGVGKTSLAIALANQENLVLPPPAASFSREDFGYGNVNLIVDPGEGSGTISTQVTNGNLPFEGIIYVMDLGHTPPERSLKDDELVKFGREVETMEDLRKSMLMSQVKDFAKTCDLLKEHKATTGVMPWIIIVMHKVDLFLNTQVQFARDWLASSGRMQDHPFGADSSKLFQQNLQSLYDRWGHDHMRVNALFASSRVENFAWSGEEIVAAIQDRERQLLLSELKALILTRLREQTQRTSLLRRR